jgi:hypothetical protein
LRIQPNTTQAQINLIMFELPKCGFARGRAYRKDEEPPAVFAGVAVILFRVLANRSDAVGSTVFLSAQSHHIALHDRTASVMAF